MKKILHLSASARAQESASYRLSRQPGGAPHARGLSSLDWSDLLIDELRAADAVVIATPMHNFTVPSVLKAWLDHVVRIGVTLNATPAGKVGTLADRNNGRTRGRRAGTGAALGV